VGNRVIGAVTAVQLQGVGGIVHPVGPDVHAAGLLAQRADEGVADPAEARWLVGTSREDDLGIRAVVG
jgi:hypothetical protein